MFFLHYDRSNNPKKDKIDFRDIIHRLNPFTTPDKSGHLEIGQLLLVQCVNWNTAASILEPAPFSDPSTKLFVASWARIDNRDKLAAKLDINRRDLDQICDSELIVKSYLKWGEACVEHLVGDFVFALYDEKKQKIFCARDHMGVRPFYYFLSHDIFVCATSLSGLMDIKGLPIKVRKQWIVDYLTQLSMSFDMTSYQGIYKLPPAHTLTVTPENHNLRQYFKLSAEPELKLKDSREYVDAYKEQLEIAIKCRLNTTYPLGSELSGGIDSSTITAFGAKLFDQPLTNFHTFAFTKSELEPQYILAVSQAFDLPYTHVIAGRRHGQDAVIERSFKILGYPVEHGNATSHEPFYQLAEKFNVRTLLSGFGGDEFGTTIHGYMVPMELMMAHQYKALYDILPGPPIIRLLRLLKLGYRKIKSHGFTEPEYTPGFYEAYSQRWPHQIVRQELVDKYNLKQRYFDQAKFDAGYTDLKKFTLENRWAPFVSTRMENCTLMAAARKIEYRWPLLDVRLVKLFLSIPSSENYYRGMGRYLHRRAIDGVVPDLVAWKKSKDMGNNVLGLDSSTTEKQKNFSMTDLPHLLEEFIDVEKFENQLHEITETGRQRGDNLFFQYRLNLQGIKKLSYWLRQGVETSSIADASLGNAGLQPRQE